MCIRDRYIAEDILKEREGYEDRAWTVSYTHLDVYKRQDLDMLHFLEQSGLNYMIALTKSDKLNKTQTEQRLNSIEKELEFIQQDVIAIPFSSVRGDGVEEVRHIISNAVLSEI